MEGGMTEQQKALLSLFSIPVVSVFTAELWQQSEVLFAAGGAILLIFIYIKILTKRL
jgi:hypothetical protein